jgi:uncharacterized protein YjbI with pentapeptide repeats
MHRFNDTDPLEELPDSFDSTERCQHTVETEALPDGWSGWCCFRPVWENTGKCIWHSAAPGKPVDDIRSAQDYERNWPSSFDELEPVRRLDEAHLRNLNFGETDSKIEDSIEQGGLGWGNHLSLEDCTLFDANFEHSVLDSPRFSNVWFNGASFLEAELNGALFRGCVLDNTDFKHAAIEDGRILRQEIRGSDWGGAYLSGLNLFETDLSGTNLRNTDLEKAHLRQTVLKDCDLEGAELEEADLRDADLDGAKLNEALLRNVRINEGTEFGGVCVYEQKADQSATDTLRGNPGVRFFNRLLSRSDDQEDLRGAVRTYRLYQRLLREASLPESIRDYRIREKHTRRKLALRESKYFRWVKLSFDRWTMLYGEGVGRVITVSMFVVLLFTGLYASFGEVASKPSNLFQMLYFSIVTFTTLGYGDIQPATEVTQILAAVESFVGVLLMALLVFVLGRRATW